MTGEEPSSPGLDTGVIILAGGNSVFVYATDTPRDRIDAMEAVLDVSYPATDTHRRRLSDGEWEAARPALADAGLQIVDTRNGSGEA